MNKNSFHIIPTLQTAISEIGLALGASRVSANIFGRQGGSDNASQKSRKPVERFEEKKRG